MPKFLLKFLEPARSSRLFQKYPQRDTSCRNQNMQKSMGKAYVCVCAGGAENVTTIIAVRCSVQPPGGDVQLCLLISTFLLWRI